jgi:Ca2+-binding EF-hand superfamily protein
MDLTAYKEKRAGAAKALQKVAAEIGDRDGLDALQEVFEKFDEDGSGGLSPDELKHALEVNK